MKSGSDMAGIPDSRTGRGCSVEIIDGYMQIPEIDKKPDSAVSVRGPRLQPYLFGEK